MYIMSLTPDYDNTQLYIVETHPYATDPDCTHTLLLSKKEIQARFRDRWKYGTDNFNTFKIWEANILKGKFVENKEIASKQFLKELEEEKKENLK